MITTTATKDGLCPRCGGDITAGVTTIAKVQGTWTCRDCGDHLEENPEIGELELGVLDDLASMPGEAAKCSLARASLKIARTIDSGIVSPRDLPPLIKELRQNRAALLDLYPPEEEDDITEQAHKSAQSLWEEPYDG